MADDDVLPTGRDTPPPLREYPPLESAPPSMNQIITEIPDKSDPCSYLPYDTFEQDNTILAPRQRSWPVLVIATEHAHQLAWKNQLQLVDLFQGLAVKLEAATPVPPLRSMNHTLHLEWANIQLKFIDSIHKCSEDSQTMLHQAAHLRESDGNLQREMQILEDSIDDLLHEQKQQTDLIDYHSTRQEEMENRIKAASGITCDTKVPWVKRFKSALDRSTDGLEHTTVEPMIVLLVGTTHEPLDPVETLQTLQSPHYLPKEYSNGLFNPKMIEYKGLLLHENNESIDDAVLNKRLHVAFGAGSSVVKVNSIAPAIAAQLAQEETSDLWSGGGSKGCFLSVSDRVALRNYFISLIQLACIPTIERNIRNINAIVSERKKGVRGVLKSFWRKEDTNAVKPGQEIMYTFDSIESQAWRLADTLFLIQDYEGAYSTYRLIKDDFKDKSALHYGGVQEMIALSLYKMDPYHREKEIYTMVEGALLAYNRSGKPSTSGRPSIATPSARLATRLCLVLASMEEVCNDRFSEVADLLAATSSNEASLGAAVLLEQASRNYFAEGMHRKYAFHMLMSGHMFRGAEHQNHALRCFTAALHVYLDGNWAELQNHVRSALAAQSFGMGRMSTALQLYAKLLGSVNIRVSAKSQEKFVSHLLEICRDHPKKALVGADKMAGHPRLSSLERSRYCQDRLDRIIQVCRSTKSASRIIEIPNMQLPSIDDRSVRVVNETASPEDDMHDILGKEVRGDEQVWKDLEIVMKSEIRASESEGQGRDEPMSRFLGEVEDHHIRRVLAEIDKENASETLLQRAKRSSSFKPQPHARAVCEPINVEFSMRNLLSIGVKITKLQLVAEMTSSKGDRACTNRDAIKIIPLESFDQSKTWNFQNSSVSFVVPDFCRLSSRKSSDNESWISAEEKEPFFVVTKGDFSFEPGSKVKVRLSICPLCEGDIQITGARWKTFDDVWTYHPFDLKGPLLQNTRSNRAHRVRGEPLELKATIQRHMPCLSVKMTASDTEDQRQGPFLQGQVSKWKLRVRNIGTAPAGRLFLKTNVPWIHCLPRDSPNLGNLNHVAGASGTMIHLPLHSPTSAHSLSPGEESDFDILVRTAGKGKQDFYMLFRYEGVSSFDDDNTEYRWLRKCFDVQVYPSLTFSASIIPSWSREAYNLSFELTNYRTDSPDNLDVKIKQLFVLSKKFGLQLLGNSRRKQIPNLVGWQERVSDHLQLSEISNIEGGYVLSQFDLSLSTVENGYEEDHTSLVFMRLERALDQFQKELSSYRKKLALAAANHDDEENRPRSIAQIRRANTSTVSGTELSDEIAPNIGRPTSIEQLLAEDENVHLICQWSDKDDTISGHHFIRDLLVQPSSSSGCPVAVSAQYQPRVSSRGGPLRMPFTVLLRNKLASSDVFIDFSLEKSDTFDLVGNSSFRCELKASEKISIPLEAQMSREGIHDLQRIRLSVKRSDSNQVQKYAFPQQWLVHAVNDDVECKD